MITEHKTMGEIVEELICLFPVFAAMYLPLIEAAAFGIRYVAEAEYIKLGISYRWAGGPSIIIYVPRPIPDFYAMAPDWALYMRIRLPVYWCFDLVPDPRLPELHVRSEEFSPTRAREESEAVMAGNDKFGKPLELTDVPHPLKYSIIKGRGLTIE